TAGVMGLLANTLVIRASLDDDPTFDALLARVRRAVLAAFEHQELPFELLLQTLEGEGPFDRSALAPVLVLWQQDTNDVPAAWAGRPLYAPEDTPRPGMVATRFDLVWECHAGSQGLDLTLLYRPARCSRAAAAALVGAFRDVV